MKCMWICLCIAVAQVRLQFRLEQERLKAVPGPVYGYFDPPWTPTFLRRNEVMLRTEGGK